MDRMEKIVSLCKRRGFVYPSSEIYGGFTSIYDYGPYGAELANNVKAHWWKHMVHLRENIVGLDSSIIMSPKIWEASGHVNGFSDPLVENKETHVRYRVDHLLEKAGVFADEKMSVAELQKLFDKHRRELDLPKGDYTPVRKFNILVQSNLGNFTEDWTKEPTFLRGETAQGIYVNYKNVLDTSRVRIPFGVAQIGKAFRNEITARQFIFRTREFEQMEMQYFVNPDVEMTEYEHLREYRMQYYLDLGIKSDHLRWAQHENLVFYCTEAFDIEYEYPFGFKELEGLHARGDYDLKQHQEHSGKDLQYHDDHTGERYLPHIVEASTGVGRNVLMHLCEAYTEEEVDGGNRVVLKLNYEMAPIKVAVFPLVRNKPELVEKARSIFNDLKGSFMCEFDDHGNIGKRYRRQDEIGTPFCVTVDYDSLEDGTVTVRDRDSMGQERVASNFLRDFFQEKFSTK